MHFGGEISTTGQTYKESLRKSGKSQRAHGCTSQKIAICDTLWFDATMALFSLRGNSLEHI